jgi:hypothetical protein
MKQGPSSEDNSLSAIQEISNPWQKWNVHYPTHSSLSLVSILIKINSIRIFPSCSLKIYFNFVKKKYFSIFPPRESLQQQAKFRGSRLRLHSTVLLALLLYLSVLFKGVVNWRDYISFKNFKSMSIMNVYDGQAIQRQMVQRALNNRREDVDQSRRTYSEFYPGVYLECLRKSW